MSNIETEKVVVDQDISDNDDVTTPFKNASDLSMTENDSKSSKSKSRNKNFFRNIFCCFKSTENLPNARNLKSKSSNASTRSKSTNHTETLVNSNPLNEINGTSLSNKNTTNLQTLTINTSNDNHSRSSKGSTFQQKNGEHGEEYGKSSFINVDTNNNNSGSSNRNTGNVQYVHTYSSNDQNNNNLYGQSTYFANGNDNINLNYVEKPLLGSIKPGDIGKKCLIIDLDETLVHSSFKQVANADFIVPVEIDGILHQVYVLKRPHVDEFLQRMGKLFECVLFTASLAKYADPVADLLDKSKVFRDRLFREACVYHRGNYVKDLARLGRDLTKVIIIDNSPASYFFHPDNAVPCTSWFDDANDTELLELIPFFEKLAACDNVYSVLKHQSNTNSLNSSLNTSNHVNQNFYQQQSIIYSTQQQNYDENQQVPKSQLQSLIYQQQQQTQQQVSTTEAQNSTDYTLNENKILLSIDLMMAKKQQQMQ